MMRLVWTALLFFCALGANSQDTVVKTANDVCSSRLDNLKDVVLKNQDRCSTDIQKSGTNLEKNLREGLKSLESKLKGDVDQGLKSLENKLLSKMKLDLESQFEVLTALSTWVETLAKKLSTATTHLEASLCMPWKTKLGGAKLTKLSTGVYHFNTDVSNKKSWQGAREFCENHGMNLVSFETAEEMRVVAAASPYNYYWYWVGASNIGRDSGLMYWTDGRFVDRSLFSRGYPKNSGRETCIELRMHNSKLAGDYDCYSEKQCFICEVAAENSQCAQNF